MTKIIAWYLPQFHKVEENNKWWGKNFTEWNNLLDWQPCFPAHRIKRPHPDIGQYDLLSPNVRRLQGDLAKKYGVYGFCYYHYWFSGKKLLEKPLELMLLDNYPDIPFCLSWANETWERRWHGRSRTHANQILQEQNYGDNEEWERHLRYLLPFFHHKNYIKIDNKPMFLIYRLGQIPNYQQRISYWRKRLREEGFEGIHLVMTLNNQNTKVLPGVDAVVEFQPNLACYYHSISICSKLFHIARTIAAKSKLFEYLRIIRDMRQEIKNKNINVIDGVKVYEKMLSIPIMHLHHYRGIFSGWDNSPRAGKKALIYRGISPDIFKRYLQIQKTRSPEFVFINAWNEWGEGAVLEPDDQFGYSYLEAIASLST